jgi:predicted SAM-dependent methyltransferase
VARKEESVFQRADALNPSAQVTLKHRIGRWLIPKLPISGSLAHELRFEFSFWATALKNRLSPSYQRTVRKLRKARGLSLNVGSRGRGLPGWVNTDAVWHAADQTFACDVRKGLPLSDGSVARIMAEHVIEHLDFQEELPATLGHFLRVLQPGGWVRIVVPDVRRFVEAYLSNSPGAWAALGFEKLPADLPTPMLLLNHVFRQGREHRFAFDFETLAFALKSAGFVEIRQCSFGQSSDPQLAIDRKEHAPYSLYVEARKP